MNNSFFTKIMNRALKLASPKYLHQGGQAGKRNLLDRETWLEQTLVKIPARSRILDAGAGELKYKKFCRHLDYISQDFAQYDGEGDGAGLQTAKWDQTKLDIVSDITKIPEPNESFDAVMCIEVLEHVPHPVEALRELTRLLRPGGYLMVTAPFASMTHFSPYFYQTGYSRYFYQYWLGEFGFEILDLQENGNYFEFLAQELNRLPLMANRYASMNYSQLEIIASNVLSHALERFSKNDKGSKEFLCFGLQLFAKKRSQPSPSQVVDH